MELSVNVLFGILLRYLYEPMKRALKLSDQGAAWGVMFVSLLFAAFVKAVTGELLGSPIPWNDPPEALKIITDAWAKILATAVTFYSLTKKRA